MADHNLIEQLLTAVDQHSKVNSLELAATLQVDHQSLVGAMMSVDAYGNVIKCTARKDKRWELTKEGKWISSNGSQEYQLYRKIPTDGAPQKSLQSLVADASVAKIGLSKAMEQGWLKIDKSGDQVMVKRSKDDVQDVVGDLLSRMQLIDFEHDVDEQQKKNLKKRKLIEEVVVKSFDIEKGSNFTLKLQKQETDLNAEMILKGTWKEKQFKEYNFDAMGVEPTRGHLHPLLKVREQYRQIFLEMGFEEMPTNQYVESSFWNFDALFQPQQHPARDAHDTFFLLNPAKCNSLPTEYMQRVKQVHSYGGYGSQGYRYDWKVEEAQKNLLRTHTTAVSSKMLYRAAQRFQAGELFHGLKYFSIDRVFRNETLDATHLAEFFQIEGVVADRGISLGHMMGMLREFFRKLGIQKLRFKPAYNPYTEPSMEIFSYHEGLGKWVEIGNSGIFRPEMMLPMGFPADVRVMAWGLSLERPTMIKYGINNIRDLCGHKIDLQMVYNSPVCILRDV